MSVENIVKLLWNGAAALEPKTYAHKLLKSYYITNCRKIAHMKLQMPKEKFGTSQMCSHCGCFWHETEFKLELQNQKVLANAKALKLISKLEKSQKEDNKNLLTGKQRRRAKWLRKRITNYIRIKCELCQHKTLIKMEKPQKKKCLNKNENFPNEEVESRATTEMQMKSKKRKKKNKTNKNAGLYIPKQHLEQEKHRIIKTPKALIPQANMETIEQVNETKLVLKSPTVKRKSNKTLISHSPAAAIVKNNKSNKKHKSKQSSKISTPPVAVQSKTQQKNSLLQLAAFLKKQTTTTTSARETTTAAKTKKRLEALLK